MEVKAGYKQSEVGVIPEEWEVRKLGELSSLRTGPFGSALHKSDYIFDGIPVINPMHIIKGDILPSQSMTIKPSLAKQLAEFLLRSGDVIIGRRGEMGRCAVVQEDQNGWLCGTGSLIIRSTGEIVPEFLQRILSSPQIVARIEESSVGSTMINLNQSVLLSLSIQLPPLPEQRAIATALSDVDALISALDKLIAKKRDIKQATMQQLLTGKTRLPGFEGGWVVKRLGKIAPLQRGFDLPTSQLKPGTYPVVYSNGILKYHLIPKVKAPGVVTGRSGTIGKVTYVEQDYWPHNTSLWVTDFKGNTPKFLYYLYTFIRLERFGSGSGVPTLNRNDVHAYHISIPSTNDEQKAIATILSDMDAEIAALEGRRDKTRALKQGMMQELLTGKTRLV
ncbi:MAG: restriction endonuclease subunit S [Ardenticatenaceae bacterium]